MSAIRTGPIRALVAVAAWQVVCWSAFALAPGDPAHRVIDELGPPPNALTIGSRQIYDYDRGQVEIEEGIVIRADLLTEEEATERNQRREAAAADVAARAQAAERLRRQQGQELLDRQIADPRFLEAPAAQRVAFFRSFSARYPDIPVDEEYRRALRDSREELVRLEAAETATATADQTREQEQAQRDALEARLRTLELEKLAREAQPVTPPAQPTTVVNVNVEVPYPDVYVLPPAVSLPNPSPPPPPMTDVRERYSISRRLPPMGTPTFGGAPAPSP